MFNLQISVVIEIEQGDQPLNTTGMVSHCHIYLHSLVELQQLVTVFSHCLGAHQYIYQLSQHAFLTVMDTNWECKKAKHIH